MRRALVVCLAFVGVVAASPQPQPVCGVCGGSLETTAETTGFEALTVERSTVTVAVHENGTATWHVRNRLDRQSATAMRDDEQARNRLVASAVERGVVDGPIRDLSTRIDNRTIHVRFRDPDAARRVGGVLVVDYLHTGGRDGWLVVTADRFTVTGPSQVTNDPLGAQVADGDATWTGNSSADRFEAPRVPTDTYVVFADGPAAGLRTTVGIAAATAPVVWRVTTTYLLPPVGLLAVGLVAIDAGVRRLRPSEVGPRRIGTLVAGLGGILLVGAGLTDLVAVGTNLSALAGVGVTLLAVGLAARRPDAGLRELVVAGVAAAVVAGLAVPITRPARFGVVGPRLVVTEAVRLAPLVVMAPAGWLAASGRRRDRAVALAWVLTAFLVTEVTVVWPTQYPFGAVVFLLLVAALAVVLAGVPLFLLGQLSRIASSTDA